MNLSKVIRYSFLSVLISTNSFAQTSTATIDTSTKPSPEVSTAAAPVPQEIEYNKDFEKLDKILHNKEFKDDNKLTDLALRARDGSLSQYSMTSSMNLAGPSLGNPGAVDLPNPDKKVGNYSQRLTGSMAARYRLDSDHSLGFGTGMVFNHPLQGVDRTDINTPFISYNIANRVRDVQMLVSPDISATTTPELQAVGQAAGASLFTSLVKDIGTSRFAISMNARASLNIYNRGYVPAHYTSQVQSHQTSKQNGVVRQPGGGDGNSQQYLLSFGPGLKYHLSDRMDVTANLIIPFYNPMRAENASVLIPNTPSAGLGLGWAYDRDLYMGPSISTLPTFLSLDNTTVGFSLVFSVL